MGERLNLEKSQCEPPVGIGHAHGLLIVLLHPIYARRRVLHYFTALLQAVNKQSIFSRSGPLSTQCEQN